MTRLRLKARLQHPAAWWLWGLGLATAASRTTNPVLLLLVIGVCVLVVAERHDPATVNPLPAFLVIGAVVVAFRIVMTALLGNGIVGETVVMTLPSVPLPDWAAGVRIGGTVTLESLLYAAYDALRLAAVLACLGAANALASPRRLLRYLPATLYDVGTAVVVGLTFAPQLLTDAREVRAARTLRGRDGRGLREMARLTVPVLETAFERSLGLAASMESRGYGRAVRSTTTSRRAGHGARARRPRRCPRRALRPARRLRRRACSGYRSSCSAHSWPARASSSARRATPGPVTAATGGRGPRPSRSSRAPSRPPSSSSPPCRAGTASCRASRPSCPPCRSSPCSPLLVAAAARLADAPSPGGRTVITFEHVSVQYADAPAPSLHDVTLEIPEGELVLVVGPTGSGKSTLLRTINGLVPHFSGGTLTRSRHRRRPRHRRAPSARPRDGRRPRRAEPVVDVRHRRRRGRGRLRHGDDGAGLDDDPPPRRGDPRPLRAHAAARPGAAHALRRSAAARRDRRALRRRPSGPRARRADVGPGSRCGRRGPGLAPSHRARPRRHGRARRAPARARRAPRRPRRPRRRRPRVRAARPCRGDAPLPDLSARRRSLPPRRVVAHAAVDPRRPPQGRRPARGPRHQHAAPGRRPQGDRARRRRSSSPVSASCAVAGSSSTASTSPWRGAP